MEPWEIMVIGDEGAPHGVVMLMVASGVYPSSCGIPVPPITAIWILPMENLVAVLKNWRSFREEGKLGLCMYQHIFLAK